MIKAFKKPRIATDSFSVESETEGTIADAVFSGEAWLLDVILDNGIGIDYSCGGMGTCGTCKVVVISGLEQLAARGEIESEMADIRGYSANERLACQTPACKGIKIRVP